MAQGVLLPPSFEALLCIGPAIDQSAFTGVKMPDQQSPLQSILLPVANTLEKRRLVYPNRLHTSSFPELRSGVPLPIVWSAGSL
jgi:hypothetical protein